MQRQAVECLFVLLTCTCVYHDLWGVVPISAVNNTQMGK